ncbi:MAG: hypothetical protein GX958_07145 [Desulfitobacterium sp.]|nr:hypothetical protein [Desulfitobacterium sp.]
MTLAITATITVFITLNAWKVERESARPYFSLQDSPKVEGKSGISFEFKFSNVGIHPATNIASRTLVFLQNMDDVPIHDAQFSLVNEIPKNMATSMVIALESSEVADHELERNPTYIVIHLQYEDPIIKGKYNQTLYYRWDGIDGEELNPLVHVEAKEMEKITQYFKHHKVNFEK